MQAQSVRQKTQAITADQSITCVQTLLKAGLGCIAYLRDLLPEDNFTSSYLTAPGSQSRTSFISAGSAPPSNKRGNVSEFKVMTVTRGWSLEADKLLDFLEEGIYDALEKSYLKSLMFVIYLDEDDPNNIVEGYTFSFQYVRVPGSGVVIPIVSLGDSLNKLSINESPSRDPIAQAVAESRLPTLGDVKKSLKAMVKQLISVINQMDQLPNRKFVKFKLFYYPHTPEDYEPPHFVASDPDRDRFIFTTRDANTKPEKCSIGKLDTGHHSIDIHIASVPGVSQSTAQDDSPFIGLTNQPNSFVRPLSGRQEDAEALQQDARRPLVVWDAERVSRMDSADLDAEGEPDPDYPVQSSGIDSLLGPWVPLGLRREDGEIVPFSEEERRSLAAMDVDQDGAALEIVYGGSVEKASQVLNEHRRQATTYEPTQPLESAPDKLTARYSAPRSSSLPPSDPISETPSLPIASYNADILNLETQREVDDDPIQSYDRTQRGAEDIEVATPKKRPAPVTRSDIDADQICCDCGVQDDLEAILCDRCCKWYHIWCMGFHSHKDERIPQHFLCFKCTIETDDNHDVMSVQSWYPTMMSNYANLALTRRAIKLCEVYNPESQTAFTKLLGCEGLVAANLFRRLEEEGFIALQTNIETVDGKNGRAAKNKKKKKAPKSTQRACYIFLRTARRSALYCDYFDPDRSVELRMIGLEAVVKSTSRHSKKQSISKQTMDSNNAPPVLANGLRKQPEPHMPPPINLKRKNTRLSHDNSRKTDRKKAKLSVSAGLGLDDYW